MTVALAVVGDVMQAPERHRFEHLCDVVVAVDGGGTIAAIEPRRAPAGEALVAAADEVITLDADHVLLPGLVDLHVHAPQWPQLGTCSTCRSSDGCSSTPSRWRPATAIATSPSAVWAQLVPTLLRHGTTTAVYFAANDVESSVSLAEACLRHGQPRLRRSGGDGPSQRNPGVVSRPRRGRGRSGIGGSIAAINALDGGRTVRPIVTPRFTPACTDALLTGLAELAADTSTPVQTHCSESDWAHGYALDRFGTTDTAALDRFGLLAGAVLAHANHVTDDDCDLIARRRAVIAHCPLSNGYFANAVLPARRLLDRGVTIGLGTDVAGGASPSLLAQCQHAVTMSGVLNDGVDARRAPSERGVAGSSIDIVTAFWMATAAPADDLAIPAERSPSVASSMRSSCTSPVGVDAGDPRHRFERLVRLASAEDITATWVDGRRATDASSSA